MKDEAMVDHPLRILNLKTYPWLLLGLCMVAGTILGYFSSLLVKPTYEAEAIVTANMEIVRNGNLTEMMVDSQMTIIGSQVYDQKVVDQVLESEKDFGNNLSLEVFRKNADFERQMLNTVLKYRDYQAEVAQRIANNWAKAFYNRLQEAYPYGIAVSAARDTLQQITKCKTDTKAQDTEFCDSLNPEKETELVDEANAVILEKSALSMGLTSSLTISNFIPAQIPDEPLRFARGTLLLASTIIGLTYGVILIEVLPGRKQRNA